MSDPIRSISQNNYLLAAQQEVSHDNTLSGNGTAESPLGLNETVLWENLTNTTQLYSGNTDIALSESFFNFERIKVYFRHSFSGNMCDSSEGIVISATDVRLGVSPKSQADNSWTLIDRAIFNFLSASPTTCRIIATTRAGISITGSTISVTTANAGIIPIRIIGINRKTSA